MDANSLVTLREQTISVMLRAGEAYGAGDENKARALLRAFQNLDVEYCAAAGLPAPSTDPEDVMARMEFYVGPLAPKGHLPPGSRMTGGAHGIPFPGARRGRSVSAGGTSWGQAFVDLRMESVGPSSSGFQAALLAPGSTAVPIPLRSQPIEDPRRARFVFELLGEEDAPNGQFSYLVQTVRDLNAAVVATGAVKPTSNFTLERVNGTTKVIAHLSQPIDRFAIEDAPLLRAFIDGELRLGLNLALDARVVAAIEAGATAGSGGVDIDGVRTAITQLQVLEYNATAIAMSPTTWEAIEGEIAEAFASNSNTPVPTDAFSRRLYDVPVMVTNSIDDGNVIVGDFSPDSAALHVTGDIRIDVSEAPAREIEGVMVSAFQTNELVFRAERRAEVAVMRPAAFVLLGGS